MGKTKLKEANFRRFLSFVSIIIVYEILESKYSGHIYYSLQNTFRIYIILLKLQMLPSVQSSLNTRFVITFLIHVPN